MDSDYDKMSRLWVDERKKSAALLDALEEAMADHHALTLGWREAPRWLVSARAAIAAARGED
jgi:hypothetical protein